MEPREASEEVLLDVHTPAYLRWLHGSKCKVAKARRRPPPGSARAVSLARGGATRRCHEARAQATAACAAAQVLEMMPILVLPNWLIQRLFVRPARFHAAGTMLVAAWALPLSPSLPLAHVGSMRSRRRRWKVVGVTRCT